MSNGQSQMIPQDSINRVPYKFGYSFKSPTVVRTTARYRKPYFDMHWAAQGPTQVKEDMWKGGAYDRYPSVWRRAAKTYKTEGLGIQKNIEVPDYMELGQAPGPTDLPTTTSTTERSWWGSLMNTITDTTATVLAAEQNLKVAQLQADAQAARMQYGMGMGVNIPYLSQQGGGMGTMGWLLLLGGIGAVGYFAYSKS